MVKICKHCGKEFKAKHANTKYCSKKCRQAHNWEKQKQWNKEHPEEAKQRRKNSYERLKQRHPEKFKRLGKDLVPEPKSCKWCKKEFIPKHGNQKYCSKECAKEAFKKQHLDYYDKNRNHVLEIKRDYYIKNKEQILEYCKEWYQKNKNKKPVKKSAPKPYKSRGSKPETWTKRADKCCERNGGIDNCPYDDCICN